MFRKALFFCISVRVHVCSAVAKQGVSEWRLTGMLLCEMALSGIVDEMNCIREGC